jgi:hypothetical protein
MLTDNFCNLLCAQFSRARLGAGKQTLDAFALRLAHQDQLADYFGQAAFSSQASLLHILKQAYEGGVHLLRLADKCCVCFNRLVFGSESGGKERSSRVQGRLYLTINSETNSSS